MKKPFILTTGEPAGIGPDLCIQLADYLMNEPVVLCGDIDLLRQRAALHGRQLAFHLASEQPDQTNSIAVEPIKLAVPSQPQTLNPKNASYVINLLEKATDMTLSGHYAGIITAPIHKGIICQAGGQTANFSGHTEFFAEKTQTNTPIMVLATEQLKVALVTTHLPLAAVPQAITTQRLTRILTGIDQGMRRYFTHQRPPRIGVCGLNPHAGELGYLGTEEITLINPTLDSLRKQGLVLSDALPADTLFVPHHANQYDIIVAMYHDQGLPVIKSHGFGACVNLTFGLPIIRTSVDHGTALDLAGTGQGNPNSLRCAVEMAKHMASNTHPQREAQ